MEAGGESILQSVARRHLEKAAYAPDMAKLSKREVKKLLAKPKDLEDL